MPDQDWSDIDKEVHNSTMRRVLMTNRHLGPLIQNIAFSSEEVRIHAEYAGKIAKQLTTRPSESK